MVMHPRFPIYIISKGRWKTPLTAKALGRMGIPFRIVVEPHEANAYADAVGEKRVLRLPFRDLGRGSIPARNWVLDHATDGGHVRHWILDDNISAFYRYNDNLKVKVDNGATFAAAEDFTERFSNVPMSGMNYHMFVSRKSGDIKPYTPNTRVYSCILLSGEFGFRWRGRYNEDTDLSLRILKAGYCTILFNAFLAGKVTTMRMSGGNTDLLYEQGEGFDGRLAMARSLQRQHPDVVRVVQKWGRWQHHVDYRPFKKNALRRRVDATNRGVDNYGMVLRDRTTDSLGGV